MKINYKNILCIILFLAVIIIFSPKSQAAGLVINFSKSTANVGDTITVTVTGQGIAGRADLTVSGPATLSESSVWVDNNSASVTANITGEGSVRITATPTSMADSTTEVAYTEPTAGTITVSSSSSSTSTSTGSSSTTSTETEESSNANLSNLGIRPNDFSGFQPGTTTYNVTVPEDVDSVEVYATAQDSSATVSGTGNQTLQYGANVLNVVVTAENGTTKTYTINVNREEAEEEETEEENTEMINGLSDIKITGAEISPEFTTGEYEYTVKYIGEDTSLDIQTVATDASYEVEIIGNEELKEGENIITILVSDSEGNNVATYQLTVNKSLVDEEALAREEERQRQEQIRMFAIAGGIIALIIIIVIIIIIKRRRNRAYAEEFSGVPFAGINDEDEYNDNYDNYNEYENDNHFNNYDDKTLKETNNDLKDNSENVESLEENLQETNTKLEFDDSEEKREKERAKRDFLEGYNTNYTEEYEEDKPQRGRKRGKRFK